ncbi:MAG: hypothetical protein NT075_21595 [Chloroflexi bacterium]|nr:hypothetical protein [Chloroflexota bacterium]
MSTELPSQEKFPITRHAPPHSQSEDNHSYLLRLWRSGASGEWRASLQSVQTGERHMFADLESLLAFLVEQSHPPPE